MSQEDPNIPYNHFIDAYKDIFDNCFPEKFVKLKPKNAPQAEWMTRGLLRSCNKRSLLYKKYKQNGTAQSREKYLRYRNKLKSILKRTQQMYYHSKFESLSGNLRQTWKLLGKVAKNKPSPYIAESFFENGNKIVNKAEIAEKLNEYFVGIGKSLAASIPSTACNYSEYLKGTFADSMSLYPTNSDEVMSIVSNFKNKFSSGYDCIPVSIMKTSIRYVAEAIANIINCSLANGVFPDRLKTAKVCPVFKSGEKDKFINYRPISVLPSFSKIFEKIVLNRMMSYLHVKDILSCSQYGFRQNHSTYMAIIDMYDKISTSLDNNEFSIGVFIDLSKAFDVLDHNILLRKLEHYGFRGIVLSWFRSYLQCRKQYVLFNGIPSSLQNISHGVPQGSILGPLLFILYINDIVNCSDILKFILFADDTNLFYSNRDIVTLMSTLNAELHKLSNWFRANRLCLNVKKSNYISFGYKHLPKGIKSFSFRLDGNQLQQVEYTKFLGVYIDSKLNWKEHVAYVKLKISRGLGIMSRVRNILPRKVMLMLYHTLIYPYLVYCNIAWGSAKVSVLNKLLILQKRAVRLCTGSDYLSPSSVLFKRLCLLKISDINKLHTGMFMFKFKNNMLPISCMNHVALCDTVSLYAIRKKSCFRFDNYRTTIREQSISIRGPKLWELLPNNVKDINNIQAFKRSLIAFYINCY